MKKALIFIITGLALFGLVFAAGCLSSDPVAGEWAWQGDDGHNYYKINGDGTGTYFHSSQTTTETEEEIITKTTSSEETFHWTKNENTYTLSFLGDETVTLIYDAAADTLTNKEYGTVLVRK